MSSSEYVLLDRKDHVLTISINRPDKLNAVITESLAALRDAVVAADNDPNVRCIILTGAGRAFCAGGDISKFKDAADEARRTGVMIPSLDQEVLESFAVAMGRSRTPIIAAINGAALGLGFSIAIGCDIRIASDKATLGATYLRMAMGPEFGASFYLVHLIGVAKACELIFNARVLNAQEAKDFGLVNQVVPAERLMPAAMEMAQNIASLPPVAMRYTKRNLYAGLSGNLMTQARMEITANTVTRSTQDHLEAASAFLEKRTPIFKGQ